MVVLGFIPMTYFKWILFACFVCSSLVLTTQDQLCDPNDLLALKEFARNLAVTSWSNDSICCQCDLVVCDDHSEISVTSRVIMLKLPKKGLKLKVLDLSHNNLSGPVAGVLSGLKMIRSLNVSSNSFTGDLSQLGEFPNLAVFNMSNNLFTGSLNSKIWRASNGILIPGRIPNVFGNLTNLEILIASSNSFAGQLPSSLALCSKLHVLELRNNSLTGQTDLNFTGLPGHCTLELGSNRFAGPLPNFLSDCRILEVLGLGGNNLTGRIPESFTKLRSIFFLSLSSNSFVDLPRALSVLQQCKNLTTVLIPMNFIGEKIPEKMSGFESLMVLALGNCGLKGHVPL
ncbi:hypothetical protein Pint_04608 [Pistacia integerrima]|uniref:Uncharacterized protein n=1 Tax=Pistacia integerrima TaxID=434235 RepID=A0ACC0Z4K2_9ROSI|nr:hypothetical protein Pint_04608 [Pistacia integerrima]